MDKSSLVPSKKCKFLGFIFDTRNMILTLPTEKKRVIKEKILFFIDKVHKCKLREFARLIGLLISACPAIKYSYLYTKEFEYFKYQCLTKNPSYDQIIRIPDFLKSDLVWWLNHIDAGSMPLGISSYDMEIFTDSSKTGWGSFNNFDKCSGFWNSEESNLHINELELKAAFLGLKCFARNSQDCNILLRIDNITAISCINRMGSIQYRHLNKITRSLWEWCEQRGITVFASYINTKDNSDADQLSRKKFQDTEWELNNDAFKDIIRCFGNPQIDLFASRCNTKCPIYVSWKMDPEAQAVDAFTLSWKDCYFYAFPPFSLMTKVLQKIIHEKAEGIVVAPYWITQPWYPLFQKLVVSEPLYFEPSADLLNSPFRNTHPLHKSLRLVAARLSGKVY